MGTVVTPMSRHDVLPNKPSQSPIVKTKHNHQVLGAEVETEVATEMETAMGIEVERGD